MAQDDTLDPQKLLEVLANRSADEIDEILKAVNTARAIAAADKERTKQYKEGSPKDPAVRELAGFALQLLRDRSLRKQIGAMEENPSYEEIGKRFAAGVSRERVRKLYADLRPLAYEAEKGHRRSA